MSFDSDAEFEESEWTPRPIVLPTFKIPYRLAAPLAWGLVASATLAVVAGLVTAISYRQPTPPTGGVLGPGVTVQAPSIGLADRIYLFTRGTASLTVALLAVVAVMVAAMAVGQDDESEGPVKHWSALLAATSVIGAIVVLANVAQAIVILSNATRQFAAPDSANKVSSILALLPPTLSATAAVVYSVTRLRTFSDETPPAGG